MKNKPEDKNLYTALGQVQGIVISSELASKLRLEQTNHKGSDKITAFELHS